MCAIYEPGSGAVSGLVCVLVLGAEVVDGSGGLREGALLYGMFTHTAATKQLESRRHDSDSSFW